MFGSIESIDFNDTVGSFESEYNLINGALGELSEILNGSNDINPGVEIGGSSESGFSIQGGGTFVSNLKVHAGLAQQLDSIYAQGEQVGASEITGGKQRSREVMVLKKIKNGIKKTNDGYYNLSNLIQTKIQNLDALKQMLEKTFNRIYDIAKQDTNQSIDKENIRSVQIKIMLEFDRQLSILQNILKVNIKPTQKDLIDLLKKNADFTTLSETLGVAYGDETASDRLALVFTNISDVKILANKVKDALKELNISFSEYKNIKNSKELSTSLYSVFKKFNKKKLDSSSDLNKILEAMTILKNASSDHDKIVKLLNSKQGRGDNSSSHSSHSSDSSDSSDSNDSSSESDEEYRTPSKIDKKEEINGGDYSKEIGRQSKTRLKSSLSKRVQIYQKTMKELYKTFMNQINGKFKSLVAIIELLTSKVGSEISYDDDLKDFIKMFLGFNENINNEKIFYSLINLDNTTSGKELRNRFLDNLDKIVLASEKLHNYSIFKDITKELKSLKELIETISDTVINLKKSEEKNDNKEGSGDFMWTDNIVEQSFSMNNIKLIKESVKKLAFYGKVATIKENLHRMNKEQKLYQEDYDKLLGKSIGLKLTELQKEYVENVDRLNDKLRGRGRLLEEHNKANPSGTSKHLPRGLVETIYKLQYEAKNGLYKSLEAIDLYLMHFTEQLSAYPEAVMDLNKMLEQTDIIAKWFTKKSVDNMFDLLSSQIQISSSDNINQTIPGVELPPLLTNSPVVQDKIKEAFEKTKKCIDSISVLKNIISMFVHLGEKYGNINLTEKLHISPNMIYKHLVKYIWVSAFTMGYGTSTGDKSTKNTDTVPKGNYELETGDFDSFFSLLFTTIILPLDIFREVEDKVMPILKNETSKGNTIAKAMEERLRKDIFIIDDRYFILGIKAMVGKIFTVVDTHSLLQTPSSLANIMRNPVRMIIGAGNTEVIPEAIELYIRLPLLVEFYKSIFEDGNQKYKNNADKDSDTEVIAYIPEIGTVWSGLLQCIFDESKYIKDGIYSINNMNNIVNEINKIVHSYKSTPKDKLLRTVVLDFVSEINRRYGILKQKDIAEFYQVKKKYVKNIVDSKFEDNVNFDILDENNEYERNGPSSQYVETSFNKYSNDSLIFTDIKLVRDFRNNIYNKLFGNSSLITELSSKSFNEKIKYYKKQITSAESLEHKFELIAQAIDQSSNINAYNVDVYILYHELVMNPVTVMDELQMLFKDKFNHFDKLRNNSNTSKLYLLSELYKHFNDKNLVKVKSIANNKVIIDYNNLQTYVESYIENIKYMISKFRNLICIELINKFETKIFKIENEFLNIMIKNDSSAENYLESNTLDYLNVENDKFINDMTKKYNVSELYKHILFGNDKLNAVTRNSPLLTDINQIYNSINRSWTPTQKLYLSYVMDDKPITNNSSFIGKSILQKFNMLVFTFIEQFYNPSTKKIYSKLIDEFANKAMSATIFEQGGIPDMFVNTVTPPTGSLNYPIITNSSVLSMTNSSILRTLLTRTLNIQLPVKYHLLDVINEVSTIQIEKYKAYLPTFIVYFENLIEECISYKKILDNPIFKPDDLNSINNVATLLTQPSSYGLTDDLNNPISYQCKLENSPGSFDEYKLHFHEVLNNIINGSRALINDSTVVLNEVNYIPQFGNIRDNFIKNFYNNNRQLPYLPVSMLTPAIVSTVTPITNLLPVHYINSDMNKYIYGTNSVLNNLNNEKEENINNYIWLKEQLNIYNNGILSTNTIDSKKVNQFLTNNKIFILHGYLSIHVLNNLYWTPNNSDSSKSNESKVEATPQQSNESKVEATPQQSNESKVEATPQQSNESKVARGESDISGGYYFASLTTPNEIINLIENQLNENKKHKIVDSLLGNICKKDSSLREYSLDRSKAIILNIIDLNINPINVHALMREVPLVNIYNYAFTFDNIIKSFVYNANPDDLYNSTPIKPSPGQEELFRLSCLLQDPYYIDYKNNTSLKPSKLLENALDINYKPSSGTYDPESSLYLSNPKYTYNIFEELNKSSLSEKGTLYHNNKFLRNIMFLVNLQRVIRLKIKKAVYKVNSNVVSDMNILNMRITDYQESSDKQPKDDEFEIADLF